MALALALAAPAVFEMSFAAPMSDFLVGFAQYLLNRTTSRYHDAPRREESQRLKFRAAQWRPPSFYQAAPRYRPEDLQVAVYYPPYHYAPTPR
jgi:hypothetical protein